MIQLWENGKNPNLGPSLEPQKFFMGFNSTSSLTMFLAIIIWNFQENWWNKLEKND